MQAHHLSHQVADYQPDQARIQHQYQTLVDVDFDDPGFGVTEDEEDGDFVGLADHVEVGGGEEGEEADGQHYSQ